MSNEAIKRLAQSAINHYNAQNRTSLVSSTHLMTVVNEDMVISDHGRTRVVIQRPRGKTGNTFEVVSVR